MTDNRRMTREYRAAYSEAQKRWRGMAGLIQHCRHAVDALSVRPEYTLSLEELARLDLAKEILAHWQGQAATGIVPPRRV